MCIRDRLQIAHYTIITLIIITQAQVGSHILFLFVSKIDFRIRQKIGLGYKPIRRLNGIWWLKEISNGRNGASLIPSVKVLHCTVLKIEIYITDSGKRKIMAVEMDTLKRSCRISRLDKSPKLKY